MGINFPTAPSEGQLFTAPGGPSYVYKSSAWKLAGSVAGSASTIIADTPPASPQPGQLWWESDTGNLFVWYADADSSQWVQVNVSGQAPVATALATNKVVNGAMQISQENGDTAAGASTATVAYYAADQWFGGWTIAPATVTNGRYVGPTPKGSARYIGMSTGTTKATPAAGDYANIVQRIEGIKVADLLWGTADAKPAVLRFWARVSSGKTFTATVRNSNNTMSYIATFTASGWQEIVIPIPGPTTGTWLTDTGIGLTVAFTLAGGSTYQGAIGSWLAGNYFSVAAMDSNLATAGVFLHIADVGFYLDPDNTGRAPPWEMPDEAQELLACQRYWYNTTGTIGGMSAMLGHFYGPAGQIQMYAGSMVFPVQMRVQPTIGIVTAPTLANCSAFAWDWITPRDASSRVTATAAGAYRAWAGQFAVNARM